MKIRCMNCMREYESDEAKCPHCGYVRGTVTAEIYHLQPETILSGRYIIGTVISFGGFGILYRAWDATIEKMIAIKEYFPTSCVNRAPDRQSVFVYAENRRKEFMHGKQDFLEEARNTAKFSKYENIVNVYNYFEENGTAYMAMEFMDGVTLKEYLAQKGGVLGWEETVKILSSICTVLKAVHAEGILHRDISPDNIMLCRDGRVKLFDFGAARFSDEQAESMRTVILKIGYAPPEQYRKKSRQGPWTDVYALGATMYRCVTGRRPEESVNRVEAAYKKEPDPLVPPAMYVPDLPDYLNTAIMRAMALEPELRFRNMEDFNDAILSNRKFKDADEILRDKKRRRSFGISAALLLLVGSIAGGCLYYRKQEIDANLGEATVTVWLEGDEKKKAVFEEMTREFSEDYPLVDVQIEAFPEDEFEQKLQEVLAGTQEMPTILEYDIFNTGLGLLFDDLSDLYGQLDSEAYTAALPSMREQYPAALPLGSHVCMVYRNVNLEEDPQAYPETNSREAFLQGKAACFVGDDRDYPAVQAALPGIYSVECPEKGIASFDSVMHVRLGLNYLDRTAARRLLSYYLGETAQDILHIQNSCAIPVNRDEASVFFGINIELTDADALSNEKETYHPFREQDVLNQVYEEVYREYREEQLP